MGKNAVGKALMKHNQMLHIVSIKKAFQQIRKKRKAPKEIPDEYINSARIFEKFKDT